MHTSIKLTLGPVFLFLFLFVACGDNGSETANEEKVLTILYWQAPSLPGAYLSGGFKDRDAGSVTLEPLAKYDPDGNIVPALAADIPTLDNGGLSADLMSITWKLKEGLKMVGWQRYDGPGCRL